MSSHPFRLRRRPAPPAVLSLLVQAGLPPAAVPRSPFRVLVRHLFDRLLNNEVFGEDAAARVAELAYAIALPGVLVALFLFPAYHGLPPHPLERSLWSQADDHLFYVTYALVILGGAVLFQWEMLFPDALDLSVTGTLPLSSRRLLLGRVLAMALFLGLVHLGTSGLGALFLPAVADQPCGFFRQFAAHLVAVCAAALAITAALVAAQSALVFLPPGRVARLLRLAVRSLSLTVLLSLLFLFPLVAHLLPELLRTRAAAWFPPFWFLGLYQQLMLGRQDPAIFAPLARTALLATALLVAVAAVLYPVSYARRVRELIEGAGRGTGAAPSRLSLAARSLAARLVFRSPPARATAAFALATLLRLERLHLALALYAGVGVALVLSGLLAFRLHDAAPSLVLSAAGLATVAPIVSFWTAAGLRGALGSPLGRAGAWLFRVIGGQPSADELTGPRLLVRVATLLITLLAVAVSDLAVLRARRLTGAPLHGHTLDLLAQLLLAVGLALLLPELFFITLRSVPFTSPPRRTVNTLPLTLVLYFVVFPTLVLTAAEAQAWLAQARLHLLAGALLLALAFGAATALRRWNLARTPPVDDLLLAGLGLDAD